ncbi:MAG TPA: MarR family winged helix-turn-helix transcriptional regulator [Micromonosporaceae bacterium]|jgi:DNA-binding MarR family transcriptional regulator
MLDDRLGYLLKRVQLSFAEANAAALEPWGINGRELAVLTVLVGDGVARSQQDAAGRLGVDRTTMVALVDALSSKGLVERRTDPGDRRRNIVVATEAGERTLAEATIAAATAEQRYLAPLTKAEAKAFVAALKRLLPAS